MDSHRSSLETPALSSEPFLQGESVNDLNARFQENGSLYVASIVFPIDVHCR